MTEQQYLASEDPSAILDRLTNGGLPGSPIGHARPSDRKLRLLCASFFRIAFGHSLGEGSPWKMWEEGEQGGSTLSPTEEAQSWVTNPHHHSYHAAFAAILRCIVGNPFRPVAFDPAWRTSDAVAVARAAYEERPGRECERCKGAGKVEEHRKANAVTIGGTYPVTCRACNGNGHVEDGALDNVRLAILADALEEAGCSPSHPPHKLSGSNLLGHLRSPGPHVKGCWAVDLILGKE